MDRSSKPRLALFGYGILGGGTLHDGIPVLKDLFKRLSNDFEIVYYCFVRIHASNVPANIRVRQVPDLPLPGRLKFFLLSAVCAFDHIRNPFSLVFAVSIYPTGQWAVRVGRIFRIPTVVQIIALEAVALTDIGYGNLVDPWLRKITQRVCQQADVLIAVAEYQKNIAITSLPTSRSIVVLPLRINCDNFPYNDRKITYPVRFIHIAYYSPIKDQDTMFRAFSAVAWEIDCHLTVIGEGYDDIKVKRLLEDLKIMDRVTFTGTIEQSQMPKYLANAHILLHTARFETGCAVIQEAMSSGVAVAGTRVGILDDIGDGYAISVPVGDDEQLSERILALINDELLYDRIRKKAYQWISKYDAVWAYENYRDFLTGVVSRRDHLD